MSTYVPPLADQFRAKVDDYMSRTGLDFSTAWGACKSIEHELYGRWQAANERHQAAVNVGETPPKDSPQIRAEALAEFTRQVNEYMAAAGVNFGAAWAYVGETQPRLRAQMNGDFARDHELAEQGLFAPVIRKS